MCDKKIENASLKQLVDRSEKIDEKIRKIEQQITNIQRKSRNTVSKMQRQKKKEIKIKIKEINEKWESRVKEKRERTKARIVTLRENIDYFRTIESKSVDEEIDRKLEEEIDIERDEDEDDKQFVDDHLDEEFEKMIDTIRICMINAKNGERWVREWNVVRNIIIQRAENRVLTDREFIDTRVNDIDLIKKDNSTNVREHQSRLLGELWEYLISIR